MLSPGTIRMMQAIHYQKQELAQPLHVMQPKMVYIQDMDPKE